MENKIKRAVVAVVWYDVAWQRRGAKRVMLCDATATECDAMQCGAVQCGLRACDVNAKWEEPKQGQGKDGKTQVRLCKCEKKKRMGEYSTYPGRETTWTKNGIGSLERSVLTRSPHREYRSLNWLFGHNKRSLLHDHTVRPYSFDFWAFFHVLVRFVFLPFPVTQKTFIATQAVRTEPDEWKGV